MRKIENRKSASPNILNVKFPYNSLEKSPLTIINIFLSEKKHKSVYNDNFTKFPLLKPKHFTLLENNYTKSEKESIRNNSKSRFSYVSDASFLDKKIAKAKSVETILPKDLNFYHANFIRKSKKSISCNRLKNLKQEKKNPSTMQLNTRYNRKSLKKIKFSEEFYENQRKNILLR